MWEWIPLPLKSMEVVKGILELNTYVQWFKLEAISNRISQIRTTEVQQNYAGSSTALKSNYTCIRKEQEQQFNDVTVLAKTKAQGT